MKPLAKLGYLGAACALLVTTFAMIGPRAAHAIVAALVRDTDNPARHPWAATCSTSSPASTGRAASCNITAPFGEEVVIQNETFGFAVADASNTNVLFIVQTETTGVISGANINGNDDGFVQPFASEPHATGTATIYTDPGATISCQERTPHDNPVNGLAFSCFLSGYYVTLP